MSGENKLIKTAKGQLSSTRKPDAAADIRSLCQPPAVIASTAAWPVVSRKWKLCTDKSRAGPERRTVIFALLLATSEQPSGRAGTKAAYCSETEPVVDGLHREPATVDGARMKEVGRVGEDRPEVSAARCPTWAGSEAKSSHRAAAFVITGRRHQPAAGNTTGVGGGGGAYTRLVIYHFALFREGQGGVGLSRHGPFLWVRIWSERVCRCTPSLCVSF